VKVKDVKVGEIFRTDKTFIYPKLKLKKGFINMRNLYIYVCGEDTTAEILTEDQLRRVQSRWRMTLEDFEGYKQELIRRYIKEVKKK
jgi:hypothetical protein